MSWATEPCRTALARDPADPASDGGSAPAMWAEIAAVKIEPRAAMPVAMPICRKVELTPEAIPALLRRDHADGGGRERRVHQAAAGPGDDEPGDQVRPARQAGQPGHHDEADADQQQAGTDQPPGGHPLAESRPASTEVTAAPR